MTDKRHRHEFDRYAENYEENIGPLIRLTGEGREYYAKGRIKWTSKRLKETNLAAETVMDFGCGTGIAIGYIKDILKPRSIVAVDPSPKSLEIARKGNPGVRFTLPEEHKPDGGVDLVFCNGVFHHIPLKDRDASMDYIYRCLKSGGVFAFWEYNVWNPLTRLGMALSPVDRDAVGLSPLIARSLAVSSGFEVKRTDYVFFFPRFLGFLRPLEHRMSSFPLGAQYMLMCVKR